MTINYIDLFDRAARFSGTRAALIDDSGTIGFTDLTALSNRFANALIARGFAPSTRFALLSPNCSAAMVAITVHWATGLSSPSDSSMLIVKCSR